MSSELVPTRSRPDWHTQLAHVGNGSGALRLLRALIRCGLDREALPAVAALVAELNLTAVEREAER